MILIISIFYFFGISASLAERLQGEGIIEGDEAKSNQFPYQVAIFFNNNVLSCGGGIIDDEFIITAAHCVIGEDRQFKGQPLTIVAGTNDLANRYIDGITIPVQKIYALKEFDRSTVAWNGDIAVLKLGRSLNIDENSRLKKLKLPEDPKETYANKVAKIAGFGYDWLNVIPNYQTGDIDEEGGMTNFKLKYLEANVMDSAICQRSYGRMRPIYNTHLCALAKMKDNRIPSGVCNGDSGGPLVYNNETIIGIVSTSPIGCRETFIPAVYTRVSSFLEFVDNAKKDNVTDSMRSYSFW